jgi:hypothetical protein
MPTKAPTLMRPNLATLGNFIRKAAAMRSVEIAGKVSSGNTHGNLNFKRWSIEANELTCLPIFAIRDISKSKLHTNPRVAAKKAARGTISGGKS